MRVDRTVVMGLLILAASTVAPACSCEEPSDEEVLRQRIDTTKVHLYVAMKIAVTKTGEDPEVQVAREQLFAALAAAHRLAARSQDASTTDDADPAPDPLTAADVLATGEDLFELSRALYALREQGQEIVRSGNEDGLRPVLPLIVREFAADIAVLNAIDMNTEHGIMLIALFAFKFHPRSPMPIPAEILLYEAWMADAGEMRVTGLGPFVRAVKAYTYAMEDLCDLAVVEGRALDDEAPAPDDLAALVDEIGGDASGFEDQQLRSGVAALRALAHGSTALCFLKREDQDQANAELHRFVDAAEEADVPPEDTALIRAYLAYQDEDIEGTRRYLTQARDSELLDEEGRGDIDELVTYLDGAGGDRDALSDYYDKAFFAAFTVKIVFRELERAGLAEEIANTPVYAAAHGWAATAGGTIEGARDAIPSFSAAADEGRGFFEGLFGGLFGDSSE